jgi:UDP-glucose 4-epimerase
LADKREIVLIGGTGFLGKHLCEQIQVANLSAFTLSRNPDRDFISRYSPIVKFASIDSQESESILKKCRVLVYLASSSLPSVHWDNPAAELEYNTLNDVRFLSEFASLNPEAHIIYASSGGQIYGSGHLAPISEEAPATPTTAYAFGKHLVERTLSFLSLIKGNPVTILRIANPVGRWQVGRKHGFVSAAINAGLTGSSLNLYGDGENIRDYFDADDFSKLVIELAQSPQNAFKIYNIGCGIGRTENEVIDLVENIIGNRIKVIRSSPRPFDLYYSVLDCTKATSEIGWLATTKLSGSIGKIIRTRL